jgi:hypothetical protein
MSRKRIAWPKAAARTAAAIGRLKKITALFVEVCCFEHFGRTVFAMKIIGAQ